MKAGTLRERFAFDKRAESSDGAGNTVADFAWQFTRSASRDFLRGGETVMASRLEGRQPVIIAVRADSATRLVTADWRCRDMNSGEAFNIRSVQPSSDRSMIEFLCEKGVAHG